MSSSWKRNYEENLPDRPPIDVLPYSNEEFIPRPATKAEKAIMNLAMEECDRQAKAHGMSRRRFMQTGAAYAVCLAAINKVMGGGYALGQECTQLEATIGQGGPATPIPLNFVGAQMNNLPGEFIMDLQTHHMDSGDEVFRTTNPGYQGFSAAVFGRQDCKFGEEIDPIECVSRFHYMKELFLDSSTNICVLSAVPYQPTGQPLPVESAYETTRMINNFAGTRRSVMHRFVMPNRGSAGTKSDSQIGSTIEPAFLQEELDLMTWTAQQWGGEVLPAGGVRYGALRAWKVYTPWGDVPYSSGWWLDDPAGRRFLSHVIDVGNRFHVPKLVCAHKGFALPTFEQDKAATRDVGIVARDFWDLDANDGVTFIIYHSGYDGDSNNLAFSPTLLLEDNMNQGTSTSSVYPLDVDSSGNLGLSTGSDENVRSVDRGVDNLIKSLRENGWSARNFATGGQAGVPGHSNATDFALGNTGDGEPSEHANVPNVYAELGSVWSSASGNPVRAARLMGKLAYYVGLQRIVWGTDALWGGSPQPEITTFRAFNMRAVAGPTTPASPNAEVRAIANLYHLPYGLDTDRIDPSKDTDNPAHYGPNATEDQRRKRSFRNGVLGWNSIAPYKIQGQEADASRSNPNAALTCEQVQSVRDEYYINPLMPVDQNGGPGPLASVDTKAMSEFEQARAQYREHPMSSNTVYGPRTRRELFASLRKDPWHRGARKMQNDNGFLKKPV